MGEKMNYYTMNLALNAIAKSESKDLSKLCNAIAGIWENATDINWVGVYILGVDSIKEFTFPLLVGILSGTYSSIFIASPLWVLFEKIKEDKKKQEQTQKKKK